MKPDTPPKSKEEKSATPTKAPGTPPQEAAKGAVASEDAEVAPASAS
jgi:hypothetical protein